MVRTTATVRRREDEDAEAHIGEIPMAEIVVGDIVQLSAGDMIPADIRLLEFARPVRQPGRADRRGAAGGEI